MARNVTPAPTDSTTWPFRSGAVLIVLTCLFFLSAVLLATPASAATCSMSVTNISFGNVDVLAPGNTDITGTVNLSCTGSNRNRNHRVCISIGAGAYSSGNIRQMRRTGGDRLNYQLYQNAARTIVWGSWQTGFNAPGMQIDTRTDNSGAFSVSVPLYARLFASQPTAGVGSYLSTFASSNTGAYARIRNNRNQACDTGGDTAQTGFNVLATVIPSCYVTATNLNFGSAGFLDANIDAAATINALCNVSLPYTVSLNGGIAGAADPALRKMRKGSAEITYGIYRDAARLLPWGSTSGVNTVPGTGAGATQSLPVYGRIPPQPTASPGTYEDTIVVTLTY